MKETIEYFIQWFLSNDEVEEEFGIVPLYCFPIIFLFHNISIIAEPKLKKENPMNRPKDPPTDAKKSKSLMTSMV